MFLAGKAYCLLISFFCFYACHLFGQNQGLADSLGLIYQENRLEDQDKLELLRNLSFNEVNNLNLSLEYAEELIDLSQRLNNNLYLSRGYFQKGNKKATVGQFR